MNLGGEMSSAIQQRGGAARIVLHQARMLHRLFDLKLFGTV